MAHCMKTYKETITMLAAKYGEKVPKDIIQTISFVFGVTTSRTKLEIKRAVKALGED